MSLNTAPTSSTSTLVSTPAPRRKADIAGIHPLTAQQQGLLFHARETGEQGVDPYFSLDTIVLEGELHPATLEAAWADTVARHPVLRTDFRWEDVPQPLQIVYRQRPSAIEWLDWRDEPDADAALATWQAGRRRAGFDFAHAADPRLTLIRVAERRWLLVWAYHHIAVDGWSYAVVLRDLLACYEAHRGGGVPKLPAARSFVDFLDWLKRQDTAAAESFWRQELSGFEAPTPLPVAAPAAPAASRWAELQIELAGRDALESFTQRERITPSTLCQGLWALLLSRRSAMRRVGFGVTVSGRPADLPGAGDMAGLFITTLPFMVDVDGRQRAGDWLRGLQARQAAVRQHEHLPLARVQGLAPESASSRRLFDSLLVVENFPVDEALTAGGDGGQKLRVRLYEAPAASGVPRATHGRNNYPLTCVFVPGATARLVLAYDRERCDDAAAVALAGQARTLFNGLLAGAERPLDELGLADERQVARAMDWGIAEPAPAFEALPARVRQWARRHPQTLAVQGADGALNYAQLHSRASALASRLRAAGVSAESRVALLAERSAAHVLGALAVMKAGAAYVPLDPAQPVARLRELVADAGAALVLAQDLAVAGQVAGECPVWSIELATGAPSALDGAELDDAEPALHAGQAAYVIYTSGSTGAPKGVVVTHGGLAQYADGVAARLGWPRGARFAMVSTVAADLGHTALYGALATGGSVHLLPTALALDPDGFAAWMREQRIDVLKIVPSHLGGLLAAAEPALPAAALVLGGEAAAPALLQRLRELAPSMAVFNHYGPTEATVGVLTDGNPLGQVPDLHPDLDLELGRALPGVRLRVLDPALQPVPVGAAGELYVGGGSLARGYGQRPDLTAERFVPDPSGAAGARLYRTGDRVQWLGDGRLRFLGRADDQVKIRGHRVEPNELAVALRRLPGVTDAAVVVREGRLLGYVTPAGVDTTAALAALSRQLPEPLWPSHLLAMPALPVTSNGKLDRRALPTPEEAPVPRAAERALTPVEQALADIWCAVLRRETVGPHDNFFALGGDSILNLQVIARARRAGLRFTPKQLFEHPTIAQLAAMAVQATPAPVAQGATASQGDAPPTPIQHWFFEQSLAEPQHWNQSVALRITRPVEPARIEAALQQLVQRHTALRLRFARTADGWRQRPVESAPFSLRQSTEPLTEPLDAAMDAVQRGLHIEQGPVFQGALARDAAGRPVLVLAAHHLVIDSVSWRVLLEELQHLVAALETDTKPALPPVAADALAWAHRAGQLAAAHEADLPYWQAVLAGEMAVTSEANTYGAARRHTARLCAVATEALQTRATQSLRGTVQELLLCALSQALCEWQGRESIAIELEGHGRDVADDLDLSQTVGWFTTRYPVRLTPGRDSAAALGAIKSQLRAVPRQGAGFGLLRATGRLGPQPAPLLCFNFLGQIDAGPAHGEPGWLEWHDEQPAHTRAAANRRSHALDFDAHIAQGVLHWSLTHASAQFATPDVQRLSALFEQRLMALLALQAADAVLPSDFPLARLSAAELGGVLARWPTLKDIYPLSPLQAGLLYDCVAEEGAPSHLNQLHLTLGADTDAAALEAAWQDTLDAHDILRSVFAWQGLDQAHQVVLPGARLPVHRHDWRERADARDALAALLRDDLHRGFALEQAPLMRLHLVRTLDALHLVWTRHHLLLDGWSSARLVGEVFERFAARSARRPPMLTPARPFRDHVAQLQRRDAAAEKSFWQTQLQGLAEPSLLQAAMPRGERGLGMGRLSQALASDTSAALEALARRHGLTLNTLVQTAWAWLLSRHTGRDDVVFGITVAGRPADLAGSDTMLGLFINTVPLRVKVPVALPLADWWRQVQAQNAALREHEQASLADLQVWSGAGPRTPLFDSLLVFENYPVDMAALDAGRHALQVAAVAADETLRMPLTLVVYPGQALHWDFVYRRETFAGADIERLANQWRQVLRAFVASAESPVGMLALAAPAIERPRRSHAPDTLVARFERQALASPDAVAVSCGATRLRYSELDARATQLALHLVRQGVAIESRVALCVERSVELVVGIVAVLKAGACYVPLDPAAPADRLRHIARDSAAVCVLHDAACAERVGSLGLGDVKTVGVADAGQERSDARLPASIPEHAAYVIYTSGSTGLPKGVVVTHANATRLFDTTREHFGFGAQDVWTLFHSFAFDFSVWELWGALLHGGRVAVVPTEATRDPAALLQLLVDERVTVLNQTPSAFYRLVEPALARRPDAFALRWVVFGGEALDPARLKPWFGHFGDRRPALVNMYGITETTVHVTLRPLSADDARQASVIGSPLDDLGLHVLDSRLQPVPEGMVGELYVGGAGLARGYLGRPDLTVQRFVPDPFAATPGARLYRSGDLARRLASGDIEYIGRADQQVKVRGYRIELGEIDAVLREHPAVSDAAVLVERDAAGEPRLLAFVAGAGVDDTALRVHAKARLPDYMLPAAIAVLPELPLTLNGKLDRSVLLALSPAAAQRPHEAPVTPLEHMLAGIWAQVLGVPRVGLHDDFFALGGHSLMATRTVARMRDATGHAWRIADLFAHPTIAALSALHVAAQGESGTAALDAMEQLLAELEDLPTESACDSAVRK